SSTGNTSCASCGSGYYCTGGAHRAACSALTGVSVSGGTYTSVSPYNANTTCRYKAPNKTITGCSAVTPSTVAYSGTAWPATTYSVTASGGYVIANNNSASATCSACTGATYSAGGTATSCSSCPAGYTSNTTAGKTAATQCQASCAAGTRVAAANAACTAITSGNVYMLAHTVNYGSTSAAATACPTGYSISGTTQADHDAKNDCKISCAGGTRVAATDATCSAAGTGYYIAAHTVSAGNMSAAATKCPTSYPNSDAGADAITKCYSGTKSRAWTGSQTACAKPANCASVTCNACSGSACTYVAYSNSAGTADGTVKSGCSTNNAACTQTVQSVTANAAYYVNGTSCSACSGLAGGFYPNSAAGNTGGASACKTNNLTGQYVATVNASSATNCGAGKYKAAHQVAYGSTSSCATASAGYFAAGPTSGSQTQCVTGSYSAAGASACIACGDGANWGMTTTGAGQTSCNKECGTVGVKGYVNAKWNANNTVTGLCLPSSCETDYYLDATRDSANNITASSCKLCSSFANGLYPHSASNGTSNGREACFVRRNELPGQYIAAVNAETATDCPAGTYNGTSDETAVHYGEKFSCTTCAADTYAAGTGNSSCTACLENYHTFGEKTSEAACRISCPGGSYLATARATKCSNVGAGYWAASSYVLQGDVGTRNACATGLTTIGYGNGADEADDCGRVLHVGTSKLYLRSTKKTTPSLNVQIGGKTYYGNMSTEAKHMSNGASQSLKLNYNNTSYSVFDDSGEFYSGGTGGGVSLSPSLAASTIVPASYAAAAGEDSWSATLSNGTKLTGIAACSATTGANGDISAAGFAPESAGTGCWCKLSTPAAGSKWVYATANAACTDKCGFYCANNMKGTSAKNITWRTNLYQSAGITVE
ncbi:MAG: hypothetical protein K2I81_03760, partial [Alphaproteobacteria bacterium]|nr:hypothetical protein [Alphaproteobacteria bacterium]